jgi:hypothetical protein
MKFNFDKLKFNFDKLIYKKIYISLRKRIRSQRFRDGRRDRLCIERNGCCIRQLDRGLKAHNFDILVA